MDRAPFKLTTALLVFPDWKGSSNDCRIMLYFCWSKVNEMNALVDLAAPPPKVCVLFPGALGDFICFLPTLEILKQNAEVDFFARPEFSELVSPPVRVRSLDCFEVRQLFVPGAARDDALYSFFGSYAAIFSWTGERERQFVNQLIHVSGGRAHFYPFRAADGKLHQTDYYLACLNNTCSSPGGPAIVLQPEAVAWIENYWRERALDGKALLVSAPGSGAREKNWPADFYLTVADWWRHRAQGAVVILLGPVEEERGGLDLLLNRFPVAQNLSLGQVAALLARSHLYLGNDSGITHLAAAVGVRTIALFGPSDAHQWAPRGDRVTILRRNVDCSPCAISVMKACPHRKCLTGLYPEDVIEKLERLPDIANLTRGGVGITV
jgi:ADP-heptose:LPS heptosyltransferase